MAHSAEYAADVWNRAAWAFDDSARAALRPGDLALADVLVLHGAANNGGLLHAVESLTPEQYDAAASGFEVLGLADAAALVREIRATAAATPDDRLGELEVEADRRYFALIPADSTIDTRFQALLAEQPDLFAPL